jgi:oligosaccharide repeat unit polymerase
MIISKKKLFLTLALFFIPLILIFLSQASIYPERTLSDFFSLNFFLILLSFFISSTFLSNSSLEDRISLRVIYWFYSYVFLGLSPIISNIASFWKLTPVNNYTVIYGLCLIIFSNVVFEIGYNFLQKKKLNIKCKFYFVNFKNFFLFIISYFVISLILIIFIGFEVNTSIIRRLFDFSFTPKEQVIEWLYRSAPAILFIFLYYINKLNKNLFYFLLLLSTLNLLLVINPFSGPRAIIFFLYFSIIITFFYDFKKFKLFFLFILLGGFFFSHIQQIIQGYIAIDGFVANYSILDYFIAGHFDGFEQIIHTLDYVIHSSSTYGQQLLGVIFFFIPRAVWPNKPIGSGDFLRNEYILNYTDTIAPNISSPLLAEMIINFSYFIGPIIFFIFGLLAGLFDYKYKLERSALSKIRLKKKGFYVSFTLIYYPLFLSCFLFVLRGDLQSGMSFAIGLVLVSFILFVILCKKNFN